VNFTKLILEYMTKVYNLSQNYPFPYSNLLTRIFKVFQISFKGEEYLHSQILTINENTPKSLKFKPLPYINWKYEEEISANDIETLTLQSYLEVIPPL